MKIYLSGKITGIEKEAINLFNAAEKDAKIFGTVINPIKLPHNHSKSYKNYMKECIKALIDCDAIYLLKNWKNSDGAILEYNIAIVLGLKIIHQY